MPWYFHWEKFYSINRRWLFYDNLCVIWFILGHIWTYFSWDLLYRLCVTINIHACKYPALPMTFTATNIYARYKAYTVAPILTCTYICACCNDCCNPSRGKYYVAWKKKNIKRYKANDAIRSFARSVELRFSVKADFRNIPHWHST